MGKKKHAKSKVLGEGTLGDIGAAINLVKKSQKIRPGGSLERYF